MPKRTSASIAKKAHAKAEADFTTWLMMAKLGGFDDLPPAAQTWLMNYRSRLDAKVPDHGELQVMSPPHETAPECHPEVLRRTSRPLHNAFSGISDCEL